MSAAEPGRRVSHFSRAVHKALRGIVGSVLLPYWQPQVQGLDRVPPQGPLLVACNHPTILDPLFLVVLFPRQLDLLMNRQVRSIPLFGRLFHQAGHVTTGQGCLRECLNRLGRGCAVGVFPEGKHTYSDQLGQLHKGVSVLAQSSGAPVLPVALCGNHDFLAPRARYLKGGPVRVGIGPPLLCGQEENAEQFSQRLRLAIIDQMDKMREPIPWKPDWRYRTLQAFWVPVSWAVFAITDRVKPDNIR